MGYLERSLGAGEVVVARAHFHWWYGFKAWAALILLFWCLIGIWIFAAMMLRAYTTEIAVTSHRFVLKTGLFNIHSEEISLHNIEGLQFAQTFWGRLLGYGRLRVEGTGLDAITIPDIADPIAFRAAIETAKDHDKA